MEHLDPQMAQRVWQRVQGTVGEDPLPGMLTAALTCAAGCSRLSKHFRGQETELLRTRAELLRQAACLRGICRLRNTPPPAQPSLPSAQEPVDALLRRCITQSLRLSDGARKEAADPEFGAVFAHLAAQAAEHTQLLLELTGK